MTSTTTIGSPHFFPKRKRIGRKSSRFQSYFDQVIPLPRSSGQTKYVVQSVAERVQTQLLPTGLLEKTRLKELEIRTSKILAGFSFVEGSGVRRFLSKNAFLLPLLEEIPIRISNYFDPGYYLSLELASDPDFPESIQLWVNVVTTETSAEARPRMDSFDMSWWLDNLDKAKEKLNITLTYV